MEFRVPLLAKKLYNNNKGISPSTFFERMRNDSHTKMLFDSLLPKDIAILCLMVGNMNENTNMKSLYDEIISNLFVFSIVEIEDDDALTDCSYCGTSGEIECDTCGGQGEHECQFCNGDGEDGKVSGCRDCSGDGTVTCDDCMNGYVTCDNCDGTGEESLYGYKVATQYYYVSYDSKLFNYLETKETILDNIPNEIMDKIMSNKKTFSCFNETGNTDEFDDNEVGDYVFVGLDKEDVDFFKTRNLLNPKNIVSYF